VLTAMATTDQTLLLINPNARRGDADISALRERLMQLAPVIDPPTPDKRAMQEAIAQHAGSVGRIVIGGGDGTLHNALASVLEAKLPLGVLPLGTANDFARSLGIADVANAIDVIVSGHLRSVDVGVVNDHYFLNAAGIGLGPRINRDLDETTKSSLGVLSYFLHFLRNKRQNRAMRAEITCDGEATHTKSLQITIGNGIHYGGGMTIAKDARIDDGMLDVLSIRPQSVLSLLIRGPALRTGNLEDNEYVQTFHGKSVRVRTRRRMEVTADGEPVTHTPVVCRAMRKVLSVYAPLTSEKQ
jgi:diacylglycerol kinase (ATP)